MQISFAVRKVEYAKRSGNLNVEASGVVKSKKHFPYYLLEDGTVEIFKPLSKTKPFTTPLFAYAEVFWSYVINRYFADAPQYRLAICSGYSEVEPKYYDYGTIVPSLCREGEHLVNLLEFYRDNPDVQVNIDNYVNYCMLFYDYTDVFKSSFIQDNIRIGEELARQVLLSILRGDQNYHYENVVFICDKENQVLRLAPVIDHEFSTMFLFPDNVEQNLSFLGDLISSIEGNENVWVKDCKEKELIKQSAINLNKNICYIASRYPNVVAEFLKGLDEFERDLDEIHLYDAGYLFSCNSYAYQIGHARYKENDEEKAVELENRMSYHDIDLTRVEKRMKRECAIVIDALRQELKKIGACEGSEQQPIKKKGM